MNLTDSQKKTLKEVDGILNNARIEIGKFSYRDMGSKDMMLLGVELVELGESLVRAALYPHGKEAKKRSTTDE